MNAVKKILVFTGGRADYGIMYWLLKELQVHPDVALKLLVSGAHLSRQFGSTFQYIENDGFEISRKVDINLSGETPTSISKSVALGIMGFSNVIEDIRPELVVLLGDRYETFAMAQAAFFLRVPVAHIHGGEITEGANDDSMRHAITKLSSIHFTSTEMHRRRVIQMGEQPRVVQNVGAPGLEHVSRSELPAIDYLSSLFEFDLSKPYFLIVFHPVTNDKNAGALELEALLKAMIYFSDYNFVISFPNADLGSVGVAEALRAFKETYYKRVLFVESFGHLNFLTILKHAEIMIGNSSSGIIEAPSMQTPSIDIGMRQRGREKAASVFSIEANVEVIVKTITLVIRTKLLEKQFCNPYEKSNSSSRIIETLLSTKLELCKKFHNVAIA